ncbi:hypothetical protein Tco_0689238 [Tanacetum coccineum]
MVGRGHRHRLTCASWASSVRLGPSLVNTVALTGLLWRVGLSLSCLSLENTLAVREGRVPLDAVTGLSLLSLGLFFLSQDSDSENCDLIVVFFTNFLKLIRGETPGTTVECLLAPFAGCVLDCGIGGVTGGCLSWNGTNRIRDLLWDYGIMRSCGTRVPCGAAEPIFLARLVLLAERWNLCSLSGLGFSSGPGLTVRCMVWAYSLDHTIRHH